MWIDLLKSVGVVAALCVVLALLLALANKYLKVKEDERITKVTSMLPNANCGGCGFPGCSGMAEALVTGKCKDINRCKPSKPEAKQAIKDYLANTPGPDGTTVKL